MISQKKIAEHLNLGRSTVANILRNEGTQKYSEETRRAVLETAEKFGYRPNRASQSVRRGRSNLIGVIHFGTAYEVSRQIGENLNRVIAAHGYGLFVVDLHWHGGEFASAIDLLIETRVEGVIISMMVEQFGAEEISRLTRAGIAVISLQGNSEWGIPIVHSDTAGAFAELTRHLINVGHKRLLLMINQYSANTTMSRIEGFTRGLREAGGELLPNHGSLDEVIQWPASKQGVLVGKIVRLNVNRGHFEPSFEYTRRLIEAGTLPDAMLCSNDHWARESIIALLQAGLRVPEDVAVTGFDNNSYADFAPYYLTTAAQPIPLATEKSVELLLQMIQKRELPQQEYVFPCSVLVRRSCGAALTSTSPRSPSSIASVPLP
jgi:LacI family repressor for deo operon, udp, cdd, tsx, nupC, and nupG